MYTIETYTYPMTIHLEQVGMFTYTPMCQHDSRLWIDHQTEGEYRVRAHRLNSLRWYELNPFQRILEATDTILALYRGSAGRTVQPYAEIIGAIAHLHRLFEISGPEETLRFFLRLSRDLGSEFSLFNLDDPMWDDCQFLPVEG